MMLAKADGFFRVRSQKAVAYPKTRGRLSTGEWLEITTDAESMTIRDFALQSILALLWTFVVRVSTIA